MALARRSDLLRALNRTAVTQRVQQPFEVTISAPIGGLNARDDVSAMRDTDALVLENWVPGFGSVAVREGSTTYASISGASDPVETVASLRVGTDEFLIAACGGAIYDVSNGGTVSSSLASGFTNARWQVAAMSGVLGMVNGADAPQIFDGSTVSAMTISSTDVLVASSCWDCRA